MLTKQWTSKSDFEGGTLTNLWVPSGLNRLELKRLQLSGTGVWIFDGGAHKKFNWQGFEHTNPNQNIYFRDDFRDNSLEAWYIAGGTWQGVNQYMKGSGSTSWEGNNARIGAGYGDSPYWPGQDILMKAFLSSGAESHRFFLRMDNAPGTLNSYLLCPVATNGIWQYRVSGGSVVEEGKISSVNIPRNCWLWIRLQIYTSGGNVIGRIKWWTPGSGEPGWIASHTWSGVWRSSGCFGVGRHTADPGQENRYDDILISRQEGIPSPPNCSVSFRFAASDDGSSWSSWQTDIKKVPNGRYIKIEATLNRNSLLSAMPTLEDITLTYKLLVQPVFI